jgi:non-specific serine/threonine protein kinase
MASSAQLSFGDLLRRHRRAAGLTQAELAERAGLSMRGINDLERGARTAPRKDTVTLLADALGLAPEERAALFAASRRPTARALLHIHPLEPSSDMTAPRTSPPAGDRPDRAVAPSAREHSTHNWPVSPTPLLGREEQLAVVCALLRRPDVRLVTLTGPGGIGKTRLGLQLALEVADTFADGIWLVQLSQVADPSLVVPTIAQTLGVREAGGQSVPETVRGYVRDKRLLLLLDNFEQVAGAAPEVAGLLESSPGLKVLVTSRMALHLRGEKEIPVPPLALPEPARFSEPERVSQSPAVALFLERAQDATPTFQLTDTTAPVVAAICAQMDGLPLAIELAAARIKVLSPRALLQRLQQRLPLLTGGPRDLPERQQTMRDTISWSYDLLSQAEQRLFRRLGVFVGGCTLEAIEAVCVAPQGAEPLGMEVLDGMSTIVDQSMVQPTGDAEGTQGTVGSEPRFGLLHVMREYALERLGASGEAEALGRAHVAYFETLAEESRRGVMRGVVEARWVRQLEREHDNLRAALGWLRERGEAQRGLRLAVGVSALWEYAGHFSEGQHWLDELLAMGGGESAGDLVVRAHAVRRSALLATFQHDVERAVTRSEEAVALARRTGDLDLIATALSWQAAVMIFEQDGEQESLEQAERYLEEAVALARRVRSARLAWHLQLLGTAKLLKGEVEQALAIFQESVALSRQIGDAETLANALQNLGYSYCLLGDAASARPPLEEALRAHRRQGYLMGISFSLIGLAVVSALEGQGERSARLLGAQEGLLASAGGRQFAVVSRLAGQFVAPARATVGEARWADAYAAGRTLSLEQAIAEALDEERT